MRHVAPLTASLLLAGVPAQAQQAIQLPPVEVTATPLSSSLTVPGLEQARETIYRTPGGVEVVPDSDFRNRPATTIKDVLEYVPGVFVQPKWGEDSRLSIRGSGLSRNFHLRSTQLYMDGIPINTADGYGDFQEIAPTAYRYVEVYKGANALRFGTNSFGGAINFVTPSGRDAPLVDAGADIGSFGFRRLFAGSGHAFGPLDYFVTVVGQEADGFREHSFGDSLRGNANFGYQITPNVETRFYVNANYVRQRIPGEVTKASALGSPQTPAVANFVNDWQRNIDSFRGANKTTLRFDETTVELGGFAIDRHLKHPIFQWLDYRYNDYGGFARVVDEHTLFGYRNRLIAGFNVINGKIDNQQFANIRGSKGALLSSSTDRSQNYSAYVEESFYVVPTVAVIAGTQYLYATRDRDDRFLSDGDQSGRTAHGIWSPRVGLLWEVDPAWQVFANISRSAEVPSFGEGTMIVPFTAIKKQKATTYEIGTRGGRTGFTWDVALYRAEIKNELQCLFSAFGNCNVTNADRTVHQGVELGLGASVLDRLFLSGGRPDLVWLQLAYTFNDFRFDDDAVFGDNKLPGEPRHFIRTELLYKHPAGFFAGPNVEWVPEPYFVDSANTLKTKSYALVGLRAGYDDPDGFSAYVEGRNLANETYISTVSIIDRATPASPLFNPGSGRGVFAGVRMRW